MSVAKQQDNLEFINNVMKSKKHFYDTKGEDYRISDSPFFFNDDVWDFNYLNENDRRMNLYKFNFANVPSQFRSISKHLVIQERFIKKNRFGSVFNTFNITKDFFMRMDELNISNYLMLNKQSVETYLDIKRKNVSSCRLETICSHISRIFDFLEENTDIKYTTLKKKLSDIGKECRTYRDAFSARNDYIPDSFLNQTVSLAIKDMNNEDLHITDRIVACLIIILAETGMRAEEVSLLESGMLDTIPVKSINKKVTYLRFKTFKTTASVGEYKNTYCYLPENSTAAYLLAEKLMIQAVEKERTQNSKYRSIIIAAGRESEIEKTNSGRASMPSMKKIIESISKEELKKVEAKRRKYIYVNGDTGRQKRSCTVLRNDVLDFYVRHKDEIDLSKLKQSEIDNLNEFRYTSEAKFERDFSVSQRKKISFEDIQDKVFYYVNPHRFRVTVCTKLFVSNIHLDYIVKHMNHLSEDMTIFYNKSYELKDELEESLNILSLLSKDNSGLIETDLNKVDNEEYKKLLSDDILKESINRINSFLEENDFNILTDIDKILKKLKNLSAPVASSDLGVCVNIISQNICEKREVIYNSLDLQVVLPTYKNIHYTYDLYKERVKIVKHNKEISIKDNIYNNEYKRELNSLNHLINTRFKNELELLQEDLNRQGCDFIIERYPYIENIIKNISVINKEIKQWN